MAKKRGKTGKKLSTPGEKASQARRTHRNKVRKYRKLLENFPQNPHKKIWEEKLEHSMKARIQ